MYLLRQAQVQLPETHALIQSIRRPSIACSVYTVVQVCYCYCVWHVRTEYACLTLVNLLITWTSPTL